MLNASGHRGGEEDGVTETHRGAPPLPLFLTEVGRASAEMAWFWAARPLESILPTGDGHPVLVLPGLLADDVSTRALRGVLRRLGYRVHGWRLGRNVGPTEVAVSGMRDRLEELSGRYDSRVSLIGWSLGGIYARTLARRSPDLVRQVITMGSPFQLARTSQTRADRAFRRYSHLHVEQLPLPLENDAVPLAMPATSIYSRSDGIVAWQACLDVPSPRAENIAVISSHLGLGHNPAVIWAVADRLAQPDQQWTPFRPPAMLRPIFPQPDRPATIGQPQGLTA
jgi:pimeloyl-ACP methyl ester carboxylesterase